MERLPHGPLCWRRYLRPEAGTYPLGVITAGRGGIYLDVHVQPNARRPGVLGVHGQRLKIAVAEPADRGKANAATLEAIAGLFGVSRASVSLVAGQSSRHKRLHIRGLDPGSARRLIDAALEESPENR